MGIYKIAESKELNKGIEKIQENLSNAEGSPCPDVSRKTSF